MNGPAWLVSLRRELVELTREPASTMWPVPPGCEGPYFNYRVEHVKQVERNALRILSHVEADTDVVLAAVWIHDRSQPLFWGERHGQQAAAWAESSLEARGFPAGKVAAVCATSSGCSTVRTSESRPKYSRMERPFTVCWPLPLTIRTRATASLRRPVAIYVVG